MLIWWLLLSALGVLASGLFSGLETGVYSLNRVRLHLLSHRGRRSARALQKMLAEPGPLLATLLIGTNVANNLATSAMSVIFEAGAWGPWQIVGAVVLIETPLLFVFAETLPKDLFAAHADRMVYPFVTPLLWLKRFFTAIGLLPLITAVSRLCLKLVGGGQPVTPFHPRRHMAALVKEGLGQGLLSDEQSALVERVMMLAGRSVADHMTPWSRVTTIQVNAAPRDLWHLSEQSPHSRFPVVDAAGVVVGVVSVTDALLFDFKACPPIAELLTAAHALAPDVPLRAALRRVQGGDGPLAIVGDRAAPLGIVTLKDLVEPITGELLNW